MRWQDWIGSAAACPVRKHTMLERALRLSILAPSQIRGANNVRKHTMLERALRLNETDIQRADCGYRQKAYNAREGIETKLSSECDTLKHVVRKHTMLERALRLSGVPRPRRVLIRVRKHTMLERALRHPLPSP